MKRLGPLSRPLFAIMLLFTIFACSGGGCSGCERCGIYPIPEGFPPAERIPNSAQIRLSESGIAFLEREIRTIVANFLDTGLRFPVERSETSGVTVCTEDGTSNDGMSPCEIELGIEELDLLPQEGTSMMRAHLRLRVNSRDTSSGDDRWTLDTGLGDCALRIDSSGGGPPYIGVQADIRFREITRPARSGYTQMVLENARLVDGEDLDSDDLDIDGGLFCSIVNLARRFVVDRLNREINSVLASALADRMCTLRGMYGCPAGTHDRGNTAADAVCYYEPAGGSDECVPTLLGMDGRGDLGGQIGGFSPGSYAPIQLLLAAGGDGEAVNNGMSLFMMGGFMSMDRAFTTSPGHNPCVPLREPPPLPDIARAEAFRGNVIPGTATPAHIGFGIAEDYLNHVGYGLYDSGVLCIGAGTRLSQQLSTGLVSAAVPSLRDLAFPSASAPLTMAIRPQQPPRFDVGTDPTLAITLDDLMIDFYVWSTERYVRFMTFQTDMTVNLNFAVEMGEIVPQVESVDVINSMVFNNEMILDPPERVAMTLQTIIGSYADMLAGGINPITLPDIMGFELDVGSEGIRGVTDSGEDFLGIFANLRVAPPAMPIRAPVETSLEVSELTIVRESMSLEHWNEGEGNSAWLDLGASSAVSGAAYEYSYRINGMTWSPWTTDSRVRIAHDVLLLQARHVIEARARIRGEAASVDATPARAELIVDIEAPSVQLSRDERGYLASANDLVSAVSNLEHRFRIQGREGEADGEWSAWQASGRFVPETLRLDGGMIEVETRDEAGNIGTARMALIRGIPNPAGGGCSCGILEGNPDRNGPLALVSSLIVLGVVLGRRRRMRPAARSMRAIVIAALAIAALSTIAGCSCGAGVATGCMGSCITPVPPASTAGSMCCEATQMCVSYDVDRLCASMPGYTCPVANVELDASCEIRCSACEPKPPLEQGLLATDLDLIVTADGDTYVSGYSPGVPPSDRYGDLVFGRVTGGTNVAWEIVDGAPDRPVVADPAGWRGGVEAPGDDVGRWTAMAEGSSGDIYIAYYDASNAALKLAVGGPGAWDVSTVDDTGDSGRYPSIVLVGGAPVISYLRIEPDPADATRLRSSVRVATASSAAPMDPTDWTIAEVGGAQMLCRPEFCASAGASGETCLETGQCVAPSTDCPAACASDQACFMGACQASLVAGYVEDIPPAYGLHTSLAVTPLGLGLVYYDRGTGNLYGAQQAGGGWTEPFLIDGYLRADPNVGDTGIAASLFVDAAGLWHVTYVDGAQETLRYAQIADGNVTVREIVDDGASPDGTTRHADGRHVVGDDSSVAVTASGEVRVVYQDDTDRTLMLARRASDGVWTVSVLDDVDNTGFWAEQVLVGTTSHVATWWRRQHRTMGANGVRVTQVD